MNTSSGASICPHCGQYHAAIGWPCPQQMRYTGQYHYTPIPLTEADIRRIVREELERALAERPSGGTP